MNGIERIIFSDKRLAFDFEDSAGDAFRLYKAAFDRSPDQVGLGFWISKLDGGMSTVEVAANFINSDEFRGLYGANPTTTEFVTELYDNILNRAPDQAGLDFYVQQIDSGAKGRDVVLADFADSQENHVQLLGQMQNGIEYITWLG
ncbi:hypothetical protein A2G96_07805 [Cupriavidus nantongensis]|uniref:DUF4214 domain-containing protein n=1 Tax=Cupriavidus nantongensis TaxID=1796606 RepID=A0A142JHT5_9BURK|nr:hypothetical protein A2G96_07805 [Cupriavidus nantongensis]